jgi:tetratricopeptide (TPR) repeat protein
MPLDPDAFWDFADPAASEQRFRAALAAAAGDDAVVLHTQIARARGMQRDFAGARAVLAEAAAGLAAAGAEAQARHALESGRSLWSVAHPEPERTEAARAAAARHYHAALTIAREAGLEALAVDALHMLALVEPSPEGKARREREALELALASDQPAARRWEPSLRHNLGLSLHALGQLDEALAEFEQCVPLRAARGDGGGERVARWMVGWTLRGLGRLDAALAVQEALERDCAAAGAPDPHVFAELAHLHRARGDAARADAYARRRSECA